MNMDLKIKDVAELLSVSETTIRRWLFDGRIPAYRIKHQYRFSRLEIENWMMECRVKPSGGVSPFQEAQEGIFRDAQEEVATRKGMQQFCLYRAIHQGDVFLDIQGSTKEEVIRGTTKEIAAKLGVDTEVLAELLLDREKLMPTALSQGIAVPHTRDFLRKGPLDMIFVVYPQQPIDYGALDGKLVHTLFFLFANHDKGHLQLLAKLAHLSSQEKALGFLQERPDKKGLLHYIRAWEGDLRSAS